MNRSRRTPHISHSRAVYGDGGNRTHARFPPIDCFFVGKGGFDCLYPVDPHHLIKQQAIRNRFPHGANFDGTPRVRGLISPGIPTQAILEDPRNIVPCCRQHHANWHNARFHVARTELPAGVEEFAREYGLEWALDRQYGARKVAA